MTYVQEFDTRRLSSHSLLKVSILFALIDNLILSGGPARVVCDITKSSKIIIFKFLNGRRSRCHHAKTIQDTPERLFWMCFDTFEGGHF